MTANRERLQETLDLLHQQLEEADSLDADVTKHLQSTMADIREVLERQEAREAAEQPTLPERLGEAARHFDESHPTISRTLGKLIDILAQMGI